MDIKEPIDFKAILKKLGVEAKARASAKAKTITSKSTELSSHETEFISAFKDAIREEKDLVKENLDNYRADLAKIYNSRNIEELEGLPAELKRLNHDTRFEEEQEFIKLKDQLTDRKIELASFANENELERDPQPQNNPMQVVFWTMSIVLLETCLNATFFAVGSDRGLLGGAIQALIISFLNVMIAWTLARLCLPQINHIDPMQKYIGGSCAFLLVVAVFMLNMFAGHYRSALEEDAFQAVIMAVNSFRDGIFEIKSAQGWLLTAVGLAAFVSLTAKIFSSDDPYPGYGKRHRLLLHAQDLWLQKQKDLVSIVINHYEMTEDRRNNLTNELTTLEGNYSVLLEKMRRLAELYATFLPKAEGLCNKVINHYRQRIKTYYGPNYSLPSYFSEAVSLETDAFFLDVNLGKEEICQEELVQRFKAYRQESSGKIKSELLSIHNDEINSLDRYFGNV